MLFLAFRLRRRETETYICQRQQQLTRGPKGTRSSNISEPIWSESRREKKMYSLYEWIDNKKSRRKVFRQHMQRDRVLSCNARARQARHRPVPGIGQIIHLKPFAQARFVSRNKVCSAVITLSPRSSTSPTWHGSNLSPCRRKAIVLGLAFLRCCPSICSRFKLSM